MSSRDAPIGLNKIPIIRIFVPYASGVLSGQEWGRNMEAGFQLLIVSGAWLVLLLLFIRNRTGLPGGHLGFGCLGFLLFLGLGFFNGRMTVQKPPDFPAGKEVLVRGRISGQPEQNGDRWRAEMEVCMLATGDTLLRENTTLVVTMGMTADSIFPGEGEEWQLTGTLQPVRNNGNPGETDYASILGRRGTWFRFYVEADSPWNRRIGSSRTQRFRPFAIRESISRHWQGDPEAVVLLKAVCLGDRSQLTRELREAYAGAGGMHLLAVSGLHVGLIWWVLQHLFSFLVRMTRSELARVVPTLFLLWCYAYMTGMSSSVTRSVMMFTLFTVARLIQHRTHPVHTILMAAFLMIVVMPSRLREVGFQLSYSAVLGIVILFPLLRNLPKGRIRNRFLRWIWEASAVSLAAQVTTAPLVFFYFRQYPVYSLVTNLVAIPVMGGLIALFVVSVPFFFLGWFPMLWNRMLILPAKGLNHLMELVAGIPGALIPVTGTDLVILLCWIGILLLAMITLQGRFRLSRYGMMFLMMVLAAYSSMQLSIRKHSGELMVAHFYNGTLLIMREGPWVDCYRWNADSAMERTMEQYVSEVWGGKGSQIRWMDKEEGGETAGKISSWQWIDPGLGMMGNDRIRGWLIDGTPSAAQLGLIIRHPGMLILISGEPSLPAAWLHDLPAGCQVVFDGTCRSRYLRKMTAEHPLVHTTFHRGAYHTTW